MSYLLDVMPELKKGKKIRRLGWPEGKHLKAVTTDQVAIEIDGESIDLETSECLLLVHPKEYNRSLRKHVGGNILGYPISSDERTVCDWEVVVEEVDKEETE